MKLNFIWHMHQPDYRNCDGIMQMPWVFLHAIKDYYDMPWILSCHANIKATFNITSPLIEQLKLYAYEPEKSDKFLALWLKDVAELEENERKWLIKLCKTAQFETMVKPLVRYSELFIQHHFTNTELIELEVLFILSWCGVYLKENNAIIKSLIKKASGYTPEDKIELLQTLTAFSTIIFDFYKELQQQQRITIATTPFYHPILPLLIDMNSAKEANFTTQIPQNEFSLKDDALRHIQRAKALFKETFGFEAKGMWPAEGAVDARSVAVLQQEAISWIATDEAILYKSLNDARKENIYSLYDYKDMKMVFRDHYLSDLIGFKYRYEEPQNAANHFINELQKIENSNANALVTVILDGENAWEFYKNNAFNFFEALYKGLQTKLWCTTLTMDEISRIQAKPLENLTAGSWINGSFDTWVGEKQKTKAWELLFITKKAYERNMTHLSQETTAQITDFFLKAESSDWYWWFGSDHYSDYMQEFDILFRNQLINIYNLMNILPPNDLFLPISQNRSSSDFLVPPQSFISPIIDGKKDSFFEWLGCGIIDETKLFSTMQASLGVVERIYYGEDVQKLYFSFEGMLQKYCTNAQIKIIIEPLNLNAVFAFNAGKTTLNGLVIESACKQNLELSIEKSSLKAAKIFIRFEIIADEKILQTVPGFGELSLNLNENYAKNWYI